MTRLSQTRLLITAGATQEPIDSVRFFGNRSSGLLGCQIALAAAITGIETTLLLSESASFPTSHPRLHIHRFSTTRDLEAKLNQYFPSHTTLIMAAAVSDFTPKGGAKEEKIPRGATMQLELVATKDLVAELSKTKRADQRIIAFALGNSDTLEHIAKQKLECKNVDAIVANPLETMDASTITATLYCKDGRTFAATKNMSKAAFADWLISKLEDICL
jgi:phosphopantothenoylcysteine decarboxylase/phosphopantothenate--cysteine ligase